MFLLNVSCTVFFIILICHFLSIVCAVNHILELNACEILSVLVLWIYLIFFKYVNVNKLHHVQSTMYTTVYLNKTFVISKLYFDKLM